jgi:hypothetical protein
MHPNDWNPFSDKDKPVKKPTIEEMDQIKCEKCENIAFDRYYKLYKHGSHIYHIPVFICGNCSEILDIKKIEDKEEK